MRKALKAKVVSSDELEFTGGAAKTARKRFTDLIDDPAKDLCLT